MGTALCGPVARAQQLLALSVWGGVRDPARWSGLDGLGVPGLCRGLRADRLRRRCLSGQRETGRVGGWHGRARAAWTRIPGIVRGHLDNRSSMVRMAGGRGGREKPGFPGTSHLRETAPSGLCVRWLGLPAPGIRPPAVLPALTNFPDGKVKSYHNLDGMN